MKPMSHTMSFLLAGILLVMLTQRKFALAFTTPVTPLPPSDLEAVKLESWPFVKPGGCGTLICVELRQMKNYIKLDWNALLRNKVDFLAHNTTALEERQSPNCSVATTTQDPYLFTFKVRFAIRDFFVKGTNFPQDTDLGDDQFANLTIVNIAAGTFKTSDEKTPYATQVHLIWPSQYCSMFVSTFERTKEEKNKGVSPHLVTRECYLTDSV